MVKDDKLKLVKAGKEHRKRRKYKEQMEIAMC